MDQEQIGKFIKQIRIEQNLTQKEFADELGVTFQAVSKWENGKSIPDISILKSISEKYSVNIDEIIKGEKIENKKNNKYPLGILIGIGILLILLIGILYINNNNDFEFKTISSNCADFKITGSAAYNKEKATIYISSIEFCGKEDTTNYKEITCTLYEKQEDTKTKISDCDTKKNTNLEDFLKEININVNHFSKTCKNLDKNSLILEINAKDSDNKTITYTIPIKLNDNCI